MFEINTVKFRQMQIFVLKILKIGAKIPWVFLGSNFQKAIAMFEICTQIKNVLFGYL